MSTVTAMLTVGMQSQGMTDELLIYHHSMTTILTHKHCIPNNRVAICYLLWLLLLQDQQDQMVFLRLNRRPRKTPSYVPCSRSMYGNGKA